MIGLPGDELRFEAGAPIINGWRVPSCRLGTASVALDPPSALNAFDGVSDARDYDISLEFLDGSAYLVAFEQGRDDGKQGPYRIRPGEFWVLGDNRNNSADSRAWNGGKGGGVPLDHLKGRARWLWLPTERFGIDLAGAPALPKPLAQLTPELKRCLAAAPDVEHTRPPPPPAMN